MYDLDGVIQSYRCSSQPKARQSLAPTETMATETLTRAPRGIDATLVAENHTEEEVEDEDVYNHENMLHLQRGRHPRMNGSR